MRRVILSYENESDMNHHFSAFFHISCIRWRLFRLEKIGTKFEEKPTLRLFQCDSPWKTLSIYFVRCFTTFYSFFCDGTKKKDKNAQFFVKSLSERNNQTNWNSSSSECQYLILLQWSHSIFCWPYSVISWSPKPKQ